MILLKKEYCFELRPVRLGNRTYWGLDEYLG